MDRNELKKQNTSKRRTNEKFKKHNKSRTSGESPERPQLRKPNQSYDLPAVQCKDTILTEYDYNAQFSKRKLSSNADRYKELSDDDDDENGQLSAADFQQLLSASTSVGDHFTFASERSWLQNDDVNPSDEGSMATDLFKLNISNLKDGLGRVPFYSRQGLAKEMFTEEEITNMNYQASFFEGENEQKPLAPNQTNQNLLNILLSKKNEEVKSNELDAKTVETVVSEKTNVEAADDELAELLQMTEIHGPKTSVKSTPTSKIPISGQSTEMKPTSTNPTKSKANKTEDIQDWLDDILNES